MRSKILNPEWFYDELSNMLGFANNEFQRELGNYPQAKANLDREVAKCRDFLRRGHNSHIEAILDENLKRLDEAEVRREGMIFDFTYVKEIEKELLESKPFRIGPATLESLLNQKPSSYESVVAGKIPFDNLFFEFAEPLELGMPFVPSKYQTRAIHLQKKVDKGDNVYSLVLYYQIKGLVASVQVDFKPGKTDFFLGRITTRAASKVIADESTYRGQEYPPDFVNFFMTESNGQYLRKCTDLGVFKKFREGLVGVEKTFAERVAINSIPHNEIFVQIPNLCINLINYINAHNVTVVRKERVVIELERDERNKKKRREHQRSFYLVTVRDEVVEEPESPKETGQWTLQERLYVRGHDRRYRDDAGNIRMTIWVNPYIKGPPNAPWREQRYAVLADKLTREKEMLKRLGV